ncbi:MAG: hypothetical protein NTY80_04285 [candidate division SR1 bacterium]|nr:hypothetical protein [candidate division SR1 bacterium]
MSGFDNEEFNHLWKKYKYKEVKTKTINTEKDTLLYETIQELNQKYGDPKISIQRKNFGIKKDSSELLGYFSARKNKIYINPKNEYLEGYGKEYFTDIRLEELAHSKQFQKRHMTKRIVKEVRRLARNGFDHSKLYDEKGTIEYEAHTTIYPELIKEFVDTYTSKIDTNNLEQITKTEIMIAKYYYTPETDKNIKYLTEIASKRQKEIMIRIQEEIKKNNETTDKYIEEIRRMVERLEKYIENEKNTK